MEQEKKKSMQSRRTQKLIVDSFFKLLSQKTYNSISVIDICDEAMISRGTFYSYFEDKTQLLNFYLEGIMLGFDKQVMNILPDKEFHAYFLELVEAVMDFFTENRKRLKTLFESSDNEIFFSAIRQYLLANFQHRLRDLKKANYTILVSEEMMTEYYCGACMELIRWWILSDKPLNKDEVVKTMKFMAIDSVDRLIEKR